MSHILGRNNTEFAVPYYAQISSTLLEFGSADKVLSI
jgi:hypothetical protein